MEVGYTKRVTFGVGSLGDSVVTYNYCFYVRVSHESVAGCGANAVARQDANVESQSPCKMSPLISHTCIRVCAYICVHCPLWLFPCRSVP